MLTVGDEAPDFSAPLANGSIGEFTLSEATDDGPVVLVFFPGAFTDVCSQEMTVFDERREELTADGGTVCGVSIDTPFALNEFRDQLGLTFGLVSDAEKELIDAYDVAMDFEGLGVPNVAKRSIFVVDSDRTVAYAWVTDDPGVEPDYDEVVDAVRAA